MIYNKPASYKQYNKKVPKSGLKIQSHRYRIDRQHSVTQMFVKWLFLDGFSKLKSATESWFSEYQYPILMVWNTLDLRKILILCYIYFMLWGMYFCSTSWFLQTVWINSCANLHCIGVAHDWLLIMWPNQARNQK